MNSIKHSIQQAFSKIFDTTKHHIKVSGDTRWVVYKDPKVDLNLMFCKNANDKPEVIVYAKDNVIDCQKYPLVLKDCLGSLVFAKTARRSPDGKIYSFNFEDHKFCTKGKVTVRVTNAHSKVVQGDFNVNFNLAAL